MAAERLYLSCSYKQCHQLLSSKLENDKNSQQTLPFRDTLILMNNKLTCELKFEQSVNSLERITEQFYMLWQLIIGLPELCDYHTTQSLMVACNVLSCFIRLWLKTGQSCHVNKSMEFIKQMKISEDSADCYMRRLLLLRKQLELITNTGTADFVSFLGDKRDYFKTGTQSDIEYEKVHQLYVDGQYSQCIDVIHKSKVCDTFTRDSQTLLLANCYARNGLYQLSLHYYYQCLRSKSSSILIHKLAATNACTVYQIINNADAEMRMRQLLLELLKEDDNSPQHSSKDLLLVWRHRDRLETNRRVIGKDWLVAGYEFVLRSKDIKNYSQASPVMTQLLHIATQEQLLSEALPSMIDLTLLACHTHLMTGDVKEAENVLSGFPVVNIRLHTESTEEYGRILILWYQSLLHIAKGDMENASSIAMHCLQTLVQFQEERAGSISEEINLKLISLKRMLLNNCAVFAIAKNNFSHAHSLLTTSISLAPDHDLLSSYNYCLLLIKLGKVKDGCKYWLEETKNDTREDFKGSFQLLTKYSNTVLLEKQSFDVITL